MRKHLDRTLVVCQIPNLSFFEMHWKLLYFEKSVWLCDVLCNCLVKTMGWRIREIHGICNWQNAIFENAWESKDGDIVFSTNSKKYVSSLIVARGRVAPRDVAKEPGRRFIARCCYNWSSPALACALAYSTSSLGRQFYGECKCSNGVSFFLFFQMWILVFPHQTHEKSVKLNEKTIKLDGKVNQHENHKNQLKANPWTIH